MALETNSHFFMFSTWYPQPEYPNNTEAMVRRHSFYLTPDRHIFSQQISELKIQKKSSPFHEIVCCAKWLARLTILLVKGFSSYDYCCRRACVPNDQCGENVVGCKTSDDCFPGFQRLQPCYHHTHLNANQKPPRHLHFRAAVHDRCRAALLRGRGRVQRRA